MAKGKFPVMVDYINRRKAQKLSTLSRPTSVPWAFIEQFERTAKENHDQTLERLAQRGGLDPRELMAVVTADQKWWDEPEDKAIAALKIAVSEFVKKEAKVLRYPLIQDCATCRDCKDPVHDFYVPDDVWMKVVGNEGTVLCWDCFADLANQQGI